MVKQRFEYLDAMRGWAIAFVIVNHTGSLVGLSGLARKLTDTMSYGVQMFFVVSAMTIFMTYRGSIDAGDAHPARDFFVRRLFRLLPVYWLGIALYFSVYGLGSRGWLPGPELWHFPVHALLLNSLFPSVQSSVVPGGWSISVEMLFYLTVPALIPWLTTLKRASLFLVAAAILGPLLSQALARAFPVTGVADPYLAKAYWDRLLFNQLGCFAVGICVYWAWRERLHERFASARANATLYLSAAVMLGLALAKLPFATSMHFYTAAFGFVVFANCARPAGLLVNRPLIWLGRISYSAYLLHFLVLKQAYDLVHWSSPIQAFGATVLAGFAITLPLAWLSFRLIEQRSTSAARYVLARLNRSPAARATA